MKWTENTFTAGVWIVGLAGICWFFGCHKDNDKAPANARDAQSLQDIADAIEPVGRYQLRDKEDPPLLFDTATGDIWLLKSNGWVRGPSLRDAKINEFQKKFIK